MRVSLSTAGRVCAVPVPPGWRGSPLGSCPDASNPAVASDARQGGDGSRTLLRSSLSSTFPILQSVSPLVPGDLVSQPSLRGRPPAPPDSSAPPLPSRALRCSLLASLRDGLKPA